MRICFDASPAVHHHAGVGRYTHELMASLIGLDHENEYCAFYAAPRGTERPDAPLDRLTARTTRLSTRSLRMCTLLAYFSGVAMDRWLPPCEVFHATDYLLPPLRRAGTVLTIYDLTFQFFPEYHLPLNRWYLALMLARYARRAGAIIATSESARRDVTRLMQIPPEKVRVIYLGVNPVFRPIHDTAELARVRQKYDLPARFILYFGTIEPRKNLLTLLEAYHALLARDAAMPDLVIAGRKGWLHQPIFQRVHELGLETRVHFTGWVDEKDVPALMNSAQVFAYPSLYEGFGLPPLEAMACGTPVICSNVASLPEVVGEAGILAEPRDVSALASALVRVLNDESLRTDLSARGLAQARKFSWERAARETLAVYQAVGSNQYAHLH